MHNWGCCALPFLLSLSWLSPPQRVWWKIKETLLMKNPVEVVVSPNRPNVYYEKVFRKGEDIAFYEEMLQPLADGLKLQKVDFPLTILYLPLRWCGFAYKFMERALGIEQYFPVNSAAVPENRLFAQYHAPQNIQMKEQILRALFLSVKSENSFCNCCHGHGS